MTKKELFFLAVPVALLGTFMIGPKPRPPKLNAQLPVFPFSPTETEKYIDSVEKTFPNLKTGNESKIYWANPTKKNKTPYCIVYLHGFSASGMEGFPVDVDIARAFGFNLYVPRLFEHGLEEKEPLLKFTGEKLLASAKEAVALGKNLGNKVILMSTSTGGTLSLYLASEHPEIQSLILYSPNIDLFDSRSFILSLPWGLEIARWVQGSDYYSIPADSTAKKYWTTRYRIEALVQLKLLLNASMTQKTFEKIKQPVLLCYYKKDKIHQDSVVSIPAMLKMFNELGTPKNLKMKVAIPGANVHPIASGMVSKDIPSVEAATRDFMTNILGLKYKDR